MVFYDMPGYYYVSKAISLTVRPGLGPKIKVPIYMGKLADGLYKPGDTLFAFCESNPTLPTSTLSWKMNNNSVSYMQ